MGSSSVKLHVTLLLENTLFTELTVQFNSSSSSSVLNNANMGNIRAIYLK